MNNRAALYLLLLLLLGSSCGVLRSPEERAKRKIKKLLDKYPEIKTEETSSRSDTLVRIDSLITKEVNIDTSFIFSSDTVYLFTEGKVSTEVRVINNERLRVKTVVQSDTIYYRDTLIREETIIREIVKPEEASFFDKYGVLLIFGFVILVFVVFRLLLI